MAYTIGSTERTNELLKEASGQTGITAPTFTIPATTMSPVTPITLPTPTPEDTAGLLGTTQGAVNYVNTLTTQQNQSETDLKNSQSDIIKVLESINGKTADTQMANESSGLNTATKQLNDLNAQASVLNREALAIPLQTQEQNRNTGATDAGIAPQNAGALRINAIKALSIAQQADVAQANYIAAKDKAQQIIDLKYIPLENALKIKMQQYEFNKDLLQSIDKKRADALAVALRKQETDLADKKAKQKANADIASDYAKYAMEAGQSDIASQISLLDTESPTFRQDLTMLQSKIKNPMMELDIAIKRANLAKLQKETNLLGQPTPAERKAEEEALRSAKDAIPLIQDKISLIDDIIISPALPSRVGTNFFSRKPLGFVSGAIKTILGKSGKDIYVDMSGQGQTFAGSVQQLSSKEFLDALIAAKAKGATFGALTDREGEALRQAGTKLNGWEIKDKDNKPTGVWDVNEASFKKELNTIKELANRALLKAQGTTISPEEQSLLEEVFTNTDPSNYYK